MTCPRPQRSLRQSEIRSQVSTSGRAPIPCQSSPMPPGGTYSKARVNRNGAGQPRSCGPGQFKARPAGPDESRISPGSGAQPLRTRMAAAAAAAAGACVAIRLGPRAGAERPPLPHASRTNKTLRSGLCEGLVAGREQRARGLAVALGDLLVLVFRERSVQQRSASRRPHLRASAADTSAAGAATTGVHLAHPSLSGHPPPDRALLGLVPSVRPGACAEAPAQRALIRPVKSPPLDTHTHTHTHTCPGARLFGANIDSKEVERSPPPGDLGPELLRGSVWRVCVGGVVVGTWAPLEQHQMSLFHPPAPGGGG